MHGHTILTFDGFPSFFEKTAVGVFSNFILFVHPVTYGTEFIADLALSQLYLCAERN